MGQAQQGSPVNASKAEASVLLGSAHRSVAGWLTGAPSYSSPWTRIRGGAGLCAMAYLGLQPSHRCPLIAKEGRRGWGHNAGSGSNQGHLGLLRKAFHSQAILGCQFMGPLANYGSVFLRRTSGNFINLNMFFLV